MSQFNDTNYPNAVPVAADYAMFVRDSDGVVRTVTMQQLATLFASLASLNLEVDVISLDTTLSTEQLAIADSAAPIAFTLPDSALNTGRGFRIFNKGVGNLTVSPALGDTIEGGASITLLQYESATLYSDGLGMWSVFG